MASSSLSITLNPEKAVETTACVRGLDKRFRWKTSVLRRLAAASVPPRWHFRLRQAFRLRLAYGGTRRRDKTAGQDGAPWIWTTETPAIPHNLNPWSS